MKPMVSVLKKLLATIYHIQKQHLCVLKKISKRTLMKMQIMTKKLQEALEQFLFLMLEMTAIFLGNRRGCPCCMLYIIKMN